MADPQDLTHPQYKKDRDMVNALLKGEITNYNLAELARLRIRYDGFPGARDIKADLDKILEKWGFTEASLFEKTREIHDTETIYKATRTKGEDWS